METETETEDCISHVSSAGVKGKSVAAASRHRPTPSNASSASATGKKKAVSQHDLLNKYFRRDVVVLKNLDLLRLVDFSVNVKCLQANLDMQCK